MHSCTTFYANQEKALIIYLNACCQTSRDSQEGTAERNPDIDLVCVVTACLSASDMTSRPNGSSRARRHHSQQGLL